MTKTVSIGYAKYLGGLPDPQPLMKTGNLVLDDTHVGIGTLHPKKCLVAWADVANVVIDGGMQSKSRAGHVAAFGILGAAARSTVNEAYLTVTLKTGGEVIYQVDKLTPQALHGKVAALLNEVGVRVGPQVATSQSSVADELAKFAALRDQGILTEEEFAAKKASLLA